MTPSLSLREMREGVMQGSYLLTLWRLPLYKVILQPCMIGGYIYMSLYVYVNHILFEEVCGRYEVRKVGLRRIRER